MKSEKVVCCLLTVLVTLFFSGCGNDGGSSTTPSGQMGGAIQSKILSLTGTLAILAGSVGTNGSADGNGITSSFYDVGGITTDGVNLYVTDGINNTIRKIVIATGAVTTIAGTAVPGTSGSRDGIGAAASFNGPTGITTDGVNLYVTDQYNNTIRKIVISTGTVSTLAGTSGVSGATDAIGAAASFDHPTGITTDGSNLYIVDSSNNTIRKLLLSTGTVTTLAGTAGGDGLTSVDGTGAAAKFDSIFAITTDGRNLYVVDSGNSILIRQIVISTGTVTTIAGAAGTPRASIDGIGTAASFYSSLGISTDGSYLYVPDISNFLLVIRKVDLSTGAVTSINLTAGFVDHTPGVINTVPFGVTTDGTNLYIGNGSNTAVCKIQ
jgi:hypothetical protein